jgi:hypothetical protein
MLISSLGIPDPRNVVSRKTTLHRCGETRDFRHILYIITILKKSKIPFLSPPASGYKMLLLIPLQGF